jgi:hypothetical protein
MMMVSRTPNHLAKAWKHEKGPVGRCHELALDERKGHGEVLAAVLLGEAQPLPLRLGELFVVVLEPGRRRGRVLKDITDFGEKQRGQGERVRRRRSERCSALVQGEGME